MKRILQAIVLTWVVTVHAQSFEELFRAVEAGDTARVSGYLQKGLDPNTTEANGFTILMIAARQGKAEVVSLLLSRRADPLRQTPSGDTAIMLAALGGHLETVRILVDAGVPVNRLTGWTALHYAAFSGSADVTSYLLERGAHKNAVAPNGYTPLMMAARNGNVAAARALLHHDPDLARKGAAGETALAIARRGNHAELVELLKRAGAAE